MFHLRFAPVDAWRPPPLDAANPDIELWRDNDGTICAYGGSPDGMFWIHLPGVATFRFSLANAQITALADASAARGPIVDAYYRTVLPLALQARGIEVPPQNETRDMTAIERDPVRADVVVSNTAVKLFHAAGGAEQQPGPSHCECALNGSQLPPPRGDRSSENRVVVSSSNFGAMSNEASFACGISPEFSGMCSTSRLATGRGSSCC